MSYSVFKLQDGRYRAVCQKPKKTIERKTKKAADQAMLKYLRDFDRQTPSSGMTLEECMNAYIKRCKERGRAQKTVDDYAKIANIVKHQIGGIKVKDLTPSDIESAMGDAAKAAINRRAFIRAAINKIAKKDDPYLPNVAELAEPPSYNPIGARALTEREVKTIIAKEIDPLCRAMWLMLAHTGLRPMEAFGLEPDELKLELDGAWVELKVSKTQEGRLPIPLPDEVWEAWKGVGLPIGRSETFWRKRFAKVCALAKVEGATLYSFRHYYGSSMAEKVREDVLKRFMRHKDVRTTKTYYVEINRQTLRDVVGPHKQEAQNGA